MTAIQDEARSAFHRMRRSGMLPDDDAQWAAFEAGFVTGVAWAIRTSSKVGEVLPLLRDFTTALERSDAG